MSTLRSFALALALAGPLALPAPQPVQAQDFTGRPTAIDGDTIAVGGQHLHLWGADAPEDGQFCNYADGTPWRCGLEATYALARLLERHWAECWLRGNNSDGETQAWCRLGGPQGFELNGQLVYEGWALADPVSGERYRDAQLAAQAAKRGIWQGTFEDPARWRAQNR